MAAAHPTPTDRFFTIGPRGGFWWSSAAWQPGAFGARSGAIAQPSRCACLRPGRAARAVRSHLPTARHRRALSRLRRRRAAGFNRPPLHRHDHQLLPITLHNSRARPARPCGARRASWPRRTGGYSISEHRTPTEIEDVPCRCPALVGAHTIRRGCSMPACRIARRARRAHDRERQKIDRNACLPASRRGPSDCLSFAAGP